MKFLKSDLIEVQIEYLGRKYFVSKFFIIFNYCLYNLENSIEGISEDGCLISKYLRLEKKPIGLFKFNDLYGKITYIGFDNGKVFNMPYMNLYFYPRTYFFVLEG